MSRIDTNAVIYGVKLTDQTYDPTTYPTYGCHIIYTKLNFNGTSSLFVQDYQGNVYGPLGAGGGAANCEEVIDAILTDGVSVLLDGSGSVLHTC